METTMTDNSYHHLPQAFTLAGPRHSDHLLKDLLAALQAQTGVPPTDNCSKVVEFVVTKHSEVEFAKFPGVSPWEYEQLQDFFDDHTSEIQRPRVRLTYLHQESTVLVEMPTHIHELPFNVLGSTLWCFAKTLPGILEKFSFTVHTNSEIIGNGIDTIVPDLAISITDLSPDHIEELLTPIIGECAFSQSKESVLQKLNAEINSVPDVIMAILIEICEHNPYQSPTLMDLTSATSAKFKLLNEPLQNPIQFLSSCNLPRTIEQPIIIAGHTWFNLASIKFTVWVQDSVVSEPINIYDANASAAAYGTLFPLHLQAMDDVNSAIQHGLELVRDLVTTEGHHDANTSSASVIDLNQTWNHLTVDLLPAVEHTAYLRYKHWYQKWNTHMFGDSDTGSSSTASSSAHTGPFTSGDSSIGHACC